MLDGLPFNLKLGASRCWPRAHEQAPKTLGVAIAEVGDQREPFDEARYLIHVKLRERDPHHPLVLSTTLHRVDSDVPANQPVPLLFHERSELLHYGIEGLLRDFLGDFRPQPGGECRRQWDEELLARRVLEKDKPSTNVLSRIALNLNLNEESG